MINFASEAVNLFVLKRSISLQELIHFRREILFMGITFDLAQWVIVDEIAGMTYLRLSCFIFTLGQNIFVNINEYKGRALWKQLGGRYKVATY